MTASLQRGTTASASEKVFNAHVIVMVCPSKLLFLIPTPGLHFRTHRSKKAPRRMPGVEWRYSTFSV